MERAEYPIWLKQAMENADVQRISEHYLQEQEAVENYWHYICKEEAAWINLIRSLETTGLDYIEVEDIIMQYGNSLQSIYFELGMKIGARLAADAMECV